MILVGIAFFGLLLVGLPIGYVLGIAGILGLVQIGGENFLAMAPKRFFEGLDLFTFMAMPFFILAGEIMNRSGITERLIGFANALCLMVFYSHRENIGRLFRGEENRMSLAGRPRDE